MTGGRYAAKLRELGKRVEVEWFDAGHIGSFARVDLTIAHHEMMLEFASRVLANLLGARM